MFWLSICPLLFAADPAFASQPKMTGAEPAYVAAERTAVLALVTADRATHKSAASGKWIDASTWEGGTIPGDGARVQIARGHTVEIHTQLAERIGWLRVDGTLMFCRACNTRLIVDTLISMEMGMLDIGTEAAPITGKCEIVIADNGPLDIVADPKEFGRGLIAMGPVTIWGKQKTTQADLATVATAGAVTFTLTAAPAGWQPGDQLVVAGTDAVETFSQHYCKIVKVAGNVVTVDKPFVRKHEPVEGVVPWVQNLSRNVVIRSENESYGAKPLGPEIRSKGHVMLMHGGATGAQVGYAEFRGLGRSDARVRLNSIAFLKDGVTRAPGRGANTVGRYALHFHRGMLSGKRSLVVGCSSWKSPKWGFTNHSSYVDFSDCVAADCIGGAFITEIGDERGSFVNCSAVGLPGNGFGWGAFLNTANDTKEEDRWADGIGMGLSGGRVSVKNFRNANMRHGVIVWAIRGPQTAPHPYRNVIRGWIDPADVAADEKYLLPYVDAFGKLLVSYFPIQIDGVQSINFAVHGFDIERQFPHAGRRAKVSNVTVVANQNFYHFVNTYSIRTDFKNLKLLHRQKTPKPPYSIGMICYFANEVVHFDGLHCLDYGTGMQTVRNGINSVTNGTFRNGVSFQLRETDFTHQENDVEHLPREMHFANNTFLPLPNGTQDKQILWTLPAVNVPGMPILIQDRVTIDGRQLYHANQKPTAVPFPIANATYPDYFVGKTNQQLFDEYGVCYNGALLPADATYDESLGHYLGCPNNRLTVLNRPGSSGTSFKRGLMRAKVKPGITYKPTVRAWRPGVPDGFTIDVPAITVQPGWNPIVFEAEGETYSVHVFGQ